MSPDKRMQVAALALRRQARKSGGILKPGLFLLFAGLFFVSTAMEAQETGIIAKYSEDGFPVVLKLVDEFPDESIRSKYSWLTVISWKYDGNDNNGMPPDEVNQAMIDLEDAIEGSIERKGYCRHAYSRTGNHLKELVYYIEGRDEFLKAFNQALAHHPGYPIEINFYEDKNWEDFQKILGMINRDQ